MPFMSGSNPFRRKQLAVLGLDNASCDSFDAASARSRSSTADSGSARCNPRPRKSRLASPRPASSGSDSDTASTIYHAGLTKDRDFAPYGRRDRSPYSRRDISPIDEHSDPFDSDLDHSGDDPHQLRSVRTLPDKARNTLDIDVDNPWRSSSLIGNSPISKRRQPLPEIPSKAQKTLGISSASAPAKTEYRRKHAIGPETQDIAPKAMRTLGIPSNPFHQPRFGHKPVADDFHPPGPSKPPSAIKTPMDVDEFKRLLLFGDKDHLTAAPSSFRHLPFPPNRDSSSTGTDVSTLSRLSIVDAYAESLRETPSTSLERLPSEDDARTSTRNFPMGPETHGSPLYFSRQPITRPTTAVSSQGFSYHPASHHTEPFASRPVAWRDGSTSSLSSPRDLNKPLPVPPEPSYRFPAQGPGPFFIEPVELPAVADPVELPADPIAPAAARSRLPPALPLARRHSQLRKRAAQEQDENVPKETDAPPPYTIHATILKPPAPPPRRNGNRSSVQLDPPSTQLPSETVLSQSAPAPQPAVQAPPPPPARAPSISKLHPRSSAPSGTAANVLPPPPPRRRGSSSSSYSRARPTPDLTPEEEESLRQAATRVATGATSGSRANAISQAGVWSEPDLLADLGKLQQDVDALRVQYEDGTGSTLMHYFNDDAPDDDADLSDPAVLSDYHIVRTPTELPGTEHHSAASEKVALSRHLLAQEKAATAVAVAAAGPPDDYDTAPGLAMGGFDVGPGYHVVGDYRADGDYHLPDERPGPRSVV